MGNYLVTGGAGFIGSHLCEALIAAGHDVVVFDNLSTGKRSNLPAKANLIEGDICDKDALSTAMKGASGCFHLAAIASVEKSNTEWTETHRVNLTGTINVFDAACHNGKSPVVYASSAAVYGAEPSLPISEHDPKRPLSAYGADKLGCELHALPAWHVHGVPSIGLRLFNVYGPRQDPKSPYSGVISIFSERLKSGRSVSIHGSGAQTRDFIYVEDVCSAFIKAMSTMSPNADVYNVCTGQETSIFELAETIKKITGSAEPFDFAPSRDGDIERSLGNPNKMNNELGIVAKTRLEIGLAATIATIS